jgi:hypothetical protein
MYKKSSKTFRESGNNIYREINDSMCQSLI